MIKLSSLIHLLLISLLAFSCAENKSAPVDHSTPEMAKPPATDSLKFTSGIRAILQDRNGNFWLGSHNEGACLFDGTSFRYFTTEDGLADNQVRSIQADQAGTIWFGTANGVSSYDGQKITRHPLAGNGIFQSEWSKMAGDLWFNAGNNPGVYRFDGQKMDYLAFPSPKVVNPNNSYLTTGIAHGADNMLWMATYAGVFGYNGDTFQVINDANLGLPQEAGLLHVRSIFEDSKGRLWMGNNGIGVVLIEGGKTIHFSEEMGLIHPGSSKSGSRSPAGTLEHVFAIEEDGDGNIWFGDRDTGAWKYDGESMANYTVEELGESQMIWEIYEDREGNLLFGMAEGGVFRFSENGFEKVF